MIHVRIIKAETKIKEDDLKLLEQQQQQQQR